MGKIKVYELAKQLQITNTEMIERLRKQGVEVKSHLSALDEEVAIKMGGVLGASNTVSKKETKSETKQPDAKPQVHIIRRNVKVINTDGDKSEVEQITTNITGDMKKSHHTVSNDNKKESSYSKEGLGVITPRRPSNDRPNMHTNRNMNVVITRNGKPDVDTSVKEKVEAVPAQNVKLDTDKKVETPNKDVDKSPNTQNINRGYDRQNNQNRNSPNPNYSNNRPPYNNQGRPPYNDQNRPQQGAGGYNNNRPPYGDRQNQTGGYNNNRPPYNNQGRPPYNDQNRPQQGAGGYNNNRPPYGDRQNQTGGYNNNRPPYNNQNRNVQGGNNYGNNTTYQVNKFIKQAATQPVEQKETREYSTVDKKKYSNDKIAADKKDKLDKNRLREANSRVATSKFKGLEVNTKSGMMDLYEREGDWSRKSRRKPQRQKPILNQTKIIPMTEVKLPEIMTVKEFAESLKKQSSDIIKKLFGLGIMATVNQEIDFDTAYLIAAEFGITAEKQLVITEEDILFDDSEDNENDMDERPPVVVVMGHVDHGKTSLLDKIREADVVQGEAGGITQHIGAYKVKHSQKEICFLDTPGHEAFTAMRARGAKVTDIAIIIVAADEGVKPQTVEAIDHAKAAELPMIVAISKMDKPNANVEKVKQELLSIGLVAEEWGGDTICIPISVVTGEGIDQLLEMILLVAEMKNLKSNPDKQAKGTIIEARLDKNIGTVVSMLVQRGTLNVSDTIVVGDVVGKVRAMKDDKGKLVKSAGPSTPVEIIGLSHVPQTGDIFYEVENEKVAKNLVEKRKASRRRDLIKQGSKVTLDDLFGQIKQGQIIDLNVIIKADVQGSVEALRESLEKLSNDEVRVRILHASTGGIKESDVTLASVSNAIIIGFNVRPEALVASQVEKEKVDMRLYRVIYDAIDDVETALKGLLPKKYKEVIHGNCEVRKVFKITGVGIVAGCYVTKGKIVRGTMVRLVRDSIVVFEIKIDSLKREKDDAKEVAEGYECGIRLEKFNDIKEGDVFECYEMEEEKRV